MSSPWKSGQFNEGGSKGWICLFYHVSHFDNREPSGIFYRSGVVPCQKYILTLQETMVHTMGYLKQIADDSYIVSWHLFLSEEWRNSSLEYVKMIVLVNRCNFVHIMLVYYNFMYVMYFLFFFSI